MSDISKLKKQFRDIKGKWKGAGNAVNRKDRKIQVLQARLAEAAKVIDGIAAAVTFNIGYPYIQLHDAKSFITAYRAKYPKGGGG